MKDDIAEVRVQDQVLLAAGLEALLAERSAPLKEKKSKTQTLASLSKTCLKRASLLCR